MTYVFKVWLREPRIAWKNDGGPIPRGFRSALERKGIKAMSVVVKKTGDRIRRGHYAVKVGGMVYSFSPDQMKRLYSRVPL